MDYIFFSFRFSQDGNATSSSEETQNKRPTSTPGNGGDLQVSNLLSLGSLGINSLSALGPVITAMAGMAGLLQSKSTATRRNDTVPPIEPQEVTTQRSPIYIPVAEFADGDIETAESQNIGTYVRMNIHHRFLNADKFSYSYQLLNMTLRPPPAPTTLGSW